ncbi:MAG: SRPBCC family protein [Acidimicrobiia bacterium]
MTRILQDRQDPFELDHSVTEADAGVGSNASQKGDPMADYQVQRSITINSNASEVYDKIVDLHKWQSWSPWEDADPSMAKSYDGPDAGVGASYSWKGNRKVGQGNMTITEANQPDHVALDLEFLKPFKARNKTAFSLEPSGEGTQVTWTMTGDHNFLSRIMSVFMSMDKMVGKDFERGLSRLKADVEA